MIPEIKSPGDVKIKEKEEEKKEEKKEELPLALQVPEPKLNDDFGDFDDSDESDSSDSSSEESES